MKPILSGNSLDSERGEVISQKRIVYLFPVVLNLYSIDSSQNQ